MLDIKILLGNRLKFLRKQAQITQEELYLRTGIDRKYISHIENGKRNVSIFKLQQLVNALGYSIKDFFNSPEFSSMNSNDSAMVADNKKEEYDSLE